MKILFISDIHGLKTNLDLIEQVIFKEKIEKIIILGDILYLYPSYMNDSNYDKDYIKTFINKYKDRILAVKGNCDFENEDLIINYNKELESILVDGVKIYYTHGHIYNDTNWDKENSILVFGHLHKPFIRKIGSNLFVNPGSISLPRGIFDASYMIYYDKTFTIYDINNKIIDSKKI